MNTKITKKGNVKVDGIKYVFVPSPMCHSCAFSTNRVVCEEAPCIDPERVRLGLPAQTGHFIKKESRL
jgi:hypothetical protein